MSGIEFFGIAWDIWLIYALIIGVFVAFLMERMPPDIIALGALAILILTGILTTKDALSVFSNPAPITIGAMFIISAALERTGCVEYLGRSINRFAGKGQLGLILAVTPVALVISAFMNNTPVVVVLTPVLIALARKMDIASSKVLIPLSYAAILGGTTTLIGTSTNLLVSGIAENSGAARFSMFEITAPGLILAAVGTLFMVLIGRHLLPARQSLSSMIGGGTGKKYIAQLLVPHNSALIGQKLTSSMLNKGEDTHILDVIRHGDSMKDHLDELLLKAGDRIVMETNAGEILGIKESGAVEFDTSTISDFEPVSASQNVVVEGIVGNNSPLIGKMVSALRFRRNYGVYVVGVHQAEHRTAIGGPKRQQLQMGDALLLEGPIQGMTQLFEDSGLVNLTVQEEQPMRRNKAPLAVLTLIAVVGLAALDVMPIAALAIIGAFFVAVTRCIEPRDIYKTIDWSILFLIFGMLGLSLGMERTGAAALVVDQVVQLAETLGGPLMILAVFYILTSVLTEIVSNNAVAALLAPIAIGVATSLGLDPKPFLVAVMFAASASFATPIGYQTNTFVYGAGGYKFKDFLVVGIPMNLIMFAVSMVVIPKFWPF